MFEGKNALVDGGCGSIEIQLVDLLLQRRTKVYVVDTDDVIK